MVPGVYRGPTEVYRGPCMKNMRQNQWLWFTSVRVRHACGVRWTWRITAGLCHAFP